MSVSQFHINFTVKPIDFTTGIASVFSLKGGSTVNTTSMYCLHLAVGDVV